MIELTADRTVCIGSGMCVLTDPEVFDQSDDDGLVTLLDVNASSDPERQTLAVPDAHAETARQAVRTCPSGALTIHED